MKTFSFIRELAVWIVCVILFTLAGLSICRLKVLIVPINYEYDDVDDTKRLINNYRIYYLYSTDYITGLESNKDIKCLDSIRNNYLKYKDSIMYDNADYSTTVEYIYLNK